MKGKRRSVGLGKGTEKGGRLVRGRERAGEYKNREERKRED